MERTSFSLLFYIRRDKLNKEGESPIFMRLTVNGERADASIKRFIEPRLWNSEKGKANEKGRGGRDLNLYLDAISANMLRIQRDMELAGISLSARAVLDRYLGKDHPERHTLLEVFREHNEKCRALSGIDYASATVIRYETCLRLTIEFIRHTYKSEDLFLDALSCKFVEDFEFYLKTVRKCCHNTSTKYLRNLKKITRIAMDKKWLRNDPYAHTQFHLEKVERDFLEKQELKKLLDKKLDIPRMIRVRDIFCFCCLTGFAFMDVQQLRPEHIATDINGMKWIRKPHQKTGNMCNVPLMEIAQEILNKYQTDPYCTSHRVLLPVCSNQKMNSYLKELADVCGIQKHLSTHTASHIEFYY